MSARDHLHRLASCIGSLALHVTLQLVLRSGLKRDWRVARMEREEGSLRCRLWLECHSAAASNAPQVCAQGLIGLGHDQLLNSLANVVINGAVLGHCMHLALFRLRRAAHGLADTAHSFASKRWHRCVAAIRFGSI